MILPAIPEAAFSLPPGTHDAKVNQMRTWARQGYAPGFSYTDRGKFTASLAAHIGKTARRRVRIGPVSFLWWARREDCWRHADRLVSEFLREKRIEFGDRGFDWSDGSWLGE